MKIVRLTEEQLREVEDSTFLYGIDSTIPEYPHDTINVSGKLNDEEYGDPETGDDTEDKMTVNFPWGNSFYGSKKSIINR